MSTLKRPMKRVHCAPGNGSLATYAAVVRTYQAEHQKNASQEMRFFSIQKSLSAAIDLAANARLPGGAKHSHQWRIPSAVLQRFAARLQEIGAQFNRAKSFFELWELARAEGMKTKGVGELAIYDTAHRIGAYLDLEPEHVYLHAGTRAGAHALGLNVDGKYLEKSRLPVEFRALRPYEIEDCLCIYKDDLAAIRANS